VRTVIPLVECCPPFAAPLIDATEVAELACVFAALGNPARMTLVQLLAASEEPVCFCHLSGPVGLAPSTVSEHLRRLVEAGVVEREERGKWSYYNLNAAAFERIGRFGGSLIPVAC
jgi:ArsR family transcriptional regulator